MYYFCANNLSCQSIRCIGIDGPLARTFAAHARVLVAVMMIASVTAGISIGFVLGKLQLGKILSDLPDICNSTAEYSRSDSVIDCQLDKGTEFVAFVFFSLKVQ